MKRFKIQKRMIPLSVLFIFFICICFVGCNSTSETPIELFMLVSADDSYEACLEETESSNDKKQCETTRKSILKQIQLRDVLSNLPSGIIDDDFPCPVGNCPDDLRGLLRDDWKSTLSKVVLRKGQTATVRDVKGNVVAKLVPGNTKSDVFKNHFMGELNIQQSSQSPATLNINDEPKNAQFTVKIPSN